MNQVGPEVRVSLYDARFAKPVDTDLILRLLEAKIPIVTVEDHGIHGGFGAAVIEAASELNLDAGLVTRLALPDAWIYQDSRSAQLKEAGIDTASIASTLREVAVQPRRSEESPILEVRSTKPASPVQAAGG